MPKVSEASGLRIESLRGKGQAIQGLGLLGPPPAGLRRPWGEAAHHRPRPSRARRQQDGQDVHRGQLGRLVIRALHDVGLSNQPESASRNDGLELKSVYITAAVRCAPPKNRPLAEEIRNCSQYLKEEVRLLDKVEIVLTLGRIAFDTYMRYMFPKGGVPKPRFRHGGFHEFIGMPNLMTSYHPSRQNTQTGRLTWEMWAGVFERIKQVLT